MKQFLLPFVLVFLSAGISCQLNAQKKDKKEKTVIIKIEKDEDGKKATIDTTFILKDGEDLHKVLEKYGVKADIHHKHANKFKFDIEVDDSLHKEGHAMVWVSVDDDGKEVHEHIIKKGGHEKVIFISDDEEDVGVKVVKLKKGEKVDWTEAEEEVFIEKMEGDSIKIKKKIIIKTDKDGKHKIKSKGGVFIVSDDDDDDKHVIIKELKEGDDSVEVIIKKIKKGKNGKKVMITTDGDYTWSTDEDIVIRKEHKNLKKIKLEILDIDDAGLKVLKLKKGYKEFKEKDFDVIVEKGEEKINFEFSTPEKGAVSVRIVDDKGNVVLEDLKKKFNGTYKNEIKAQNGTFYIQIIQGKKYHLKKMIFELNK
jgi:hypothetical protein